MTYAELINQIRIEIKDYKRRAIDKWNGDGSSTFFESDKHPIIENSYEISVSSVQKTESTHYTLDKDLGELVFTAGNAPASANDNVQMIYRYANFRDNDYLTFLIAAIRNYRDKLWTEAIDEGTVTSVAEQYEYSLSTISSNILYIIEAAIRQNSGLDWQPLNSVTQWRYIRDLNKLSLVHPISFTGFQFRFVYGLTVAIPSSPATSDTFPIGDRFINVIKEYVKYQYYQALASKLMADTSIKTQLETFEKPNVLFSIANNHKVNAEQELKRVRKLLPPISASIIRR